MTQDQTEGSGSPERKPNNRPIYDALQESLGLIELAFAPTQPSFKRDRAQTATGRERSITSFLEAYFPSDWSVKKGPIYDRYGNVSAEVDCAICIPQHPQIRTLTRDVILAEGVHSAVEVKPDISVLSSEGEFARSLKQAVSVKRLSRTLTHFNRRNPQWPPEAHRIPYVVFASRATGLEKTAGFITEQKLLNGWDSWDLPDLVVSYRDGIIYHAPEASICSIAPYFKLAEFGSGEGYIIFEEAKHTLVLFLALLFSYTSPQTQIGEVILKDYLFPIFVTGETKFLKVSDE